MSKITIKLKIEYNVDIINYIDIEEHIIDYLSRTKGIKKVSVEEIDESDLT